MFTDEVGAPHVWKVDGEMRVGKAPVEVGDLRGDQVIVLDGLEAGETIVTAGVHHLEEGQQVFLKPPADRPKLPKPEEAPSEYAITGIYMYDHQVFDIIRTLKPSDRGELEITDVNNRYIQKGQLTYDVLDGWWTDAGTIESLLRAKA